MLLFTIMLEKVLTHFRGYLCHYRLHLCIQFATSCNISGIVIAVIGIYIHTHTHTHAHIHTHTNKHKHTLTHTHTHTPLYTVILHTPTFISCHAVVIVILYLYRAHHSDLLYYHHPTKAQHTLIHMDHMITH